MTALTRVTTRAAGVQLGEQTLRILFSGRRFRERQHVTQRGMQVEGRGDHVLVVRQRSHHIRVFVPQPLGHGNRQPR